MARIPQEQPLLPSVLDRLLDLEPDLRSEVPKSRGQLLRELKQSVRRDLEDLLNTRWRCLSWPEEFRELANSLVAYGIPDFTGSNMSIPSQRDYLRRTIESAIRQFDPRFKSVSVTLLTNSDSSDRNLHFRIDGMLHAEPAPEPVVFDSSMDASSATFEVSSPQS